jgi:Mn-containing catalase
MSQIRELLIDQMQDLLNAEGQLVNALPKMVEAAQHPKLKEAFQKHLQQTEQQVERLRSAFEILGEEPESKPCRGMMGLIEEGEEVIAKADGKDPLCADLALIAAAQKVEHYEISAYGTAKCLARDIGETRCAALLSQSLGEEESTDALLTMISNPIVQQLSLDDMGGSVNLNSVGTESSQVEQSNKARPRKAKRAAA